MGLLLGTPTAYSSNYTVDVLQAIARDRPTQAFSAGTGAIQGLDRWNCYELSWLDLHGCPSQAVAQITVSAESLFLVESKSLKLYLNGFTNTKFESLARVEQTIENDLASLLKTVVGVLLTDVSEYAPVSCSLPGISLDQNALPGVSANPSHNILKVDATATGEFSYYTHLFRSICPVTSQPDWASVIIYGQGAAPAASELLAYLLSYREHAGFHESCADRIFSDLMQAILPEQLLLVCYFTRRGGIDITPFRWSVNFKNDSLLQRLHGVRTNRQ